MSAIRPTASGFEWEGMTVERFAELPDYRTVLRVHGTKRYVDVYVSGSGRSVRVFNHEGQELFPDATDPGSKGEA